MLDIINIITDNDYISITELSRLLCKISNTNNISPKIINQILLDNHFIAKSNKTLLDKEKKLGLKPSKYIPTSSSLNIRFPILKSI